MTDRRIANTIRRPFPMSASSAAALSAAFANERGLGADTNGKPKRLRPGGADEASKRASEVLVLTFRPGLALALPIDPRVDLVGDLGQQREVVAAEAA